MKEGESFVRAVYKFLKGEAKEAIAFYEDVFDTKCQNLMTFAEAPEDPGASYKRRDKGFSDERKYHY